MLLPPGVKILNTALFEIDNAPFIELSQDIITTSDGIDSTTDLVVTDINESSSSNLIEKKLFYRL